VAQRRTTVIGFSAVSLRDCHSSRGISFFDFPLTVPQTLATSTMSERRKSTTGRYVYGMIMTG